MDSDTVAAASLHPLLEAGARLPAAGSEEPGPRIGAAYDGEGGYLDSDTDTLDMCRGVVQLPHLQPHPAAPRHRVG